MLYAGTQPFSWVLGLVAHILQVNATGEPPRPHRGVHLEHVCVCGCVADGEIYML